MLNRLAIWRMEIAGVRLHQNMFTFLIENRLGCRNHLIRNTTNQFFLSTFCLSLLFAMLPQTLNE